MIQRDIGSVKDASGELSRKKSKFSLELKDALEEEKKIMEQYRNLQKSLHEYRKKKGTYRKPVASKPDTKSKPLTVFSQSVRIDKDEHSSGTLALSGQILLF